MKIVIATFNLGKLKEFKSLFKNSKFEVLALNDFSSEDIEETGKSYEENALLKAKAAAKKTSLLAIGDDSGLEVSSLNNDPGLFSARYAGKDSTDEENISKLLKKMKLLKNSKAKFVSTLAFYDPQKKIELFSYGELYGEIISERKGNKGFGYDPIFKIKNSNKTLGEISFEERMKISHRAKSTVNMINFLNQIYK